MSHISSVHEDLHMSVYLIVDYLTSGGARSAPLT